MAHKFTGSEGEMISLAEANNYVSTYKKSDNFAANKNIKAFFYGREKLQELLNQNDCVGIRIYYGGERDAHGGYSPALVLVGADENMDDLANGKILERGAPCPPLCPTSIALDDK